MNTSNITNYKPKDFAELIGVSVNPPQRWDREGTLKANLTPTDRRYYTYDQYLQFKGINTENDNRQIVIYTKVSTKNQKDDKNQIEGDVEIVKELQDGNKSNQRTESEKKKNDWNLPICVQLLYRPQ